MPPKKTKNEKNIEKTIVKDNEIENEIENEKNTEIENETDTKIKKKEKASKPSKSSKSSKSSKKDIKVEKEIIPASDRVYSGKQVVIVESPNKIKKIKEILDKIKTLPNFTNCKFNVVASFGHIRCVDPTKVGIDINNNFEPQYIISDDKQHVVYDLKEIISDAEMVWLAADADREGEAIAWHCMDVLGLKDENYNRITFNEITEKAIKEAMLHPRRIDLNMYYSQKARVTIDKLIGYLISPVLDSQFETFGLSAGRVQSVACKLVAEREKEIEKFESSGYYQVKGTFNPVKEETKGLLIPADLETTIENKEKTLEFLELGNKAEFKIIDITNNKTTRKPPPPLITSSLQQEASIKYGINPETCMKLAQKLYEAGFITYMRTDSVSLSNDARKDIKEFVENGFGEKFHHSNFYANKDNSQEAHEAIRPTYIEKKNVLDSLGMAENKIYQLIWRRAVASQMSPAELMVKIVKIGMNNSDLTFVSRAEKIIFKGYLSIYDNNNTNTKSKSNDKSNDKSNKKDKVNKGKDSDEEDGENGEEEGLIDDVEFYELLNNLEVDDILNYRLLEGIEKYSKPIPRYTEASLVKELEKRGLGRPSTYASLIKKILDPKKNYVNILSKNAVSVDNFILQYKSGKFTEKTVKVNTGGYKNKMVCMEIGKKVVEFLDENFNKIMDYNYTRDVETAFDEIAENKHIWHDVVKDNYNSFYPQIELIRQKHMAGDKGKIKKYLGIDPVSGEDVNILYGNGGQKICLDTKDKTNKKYCNITNEEANEITLARALELLKYPIILKAPSNKNIEEDKPEGKTEGKLEGKQKEYDIEICKGKTNYYLKKNNKSISLSENVEKEPDIMTWNEANKLFTIEEEKAQSNILKTFEEDKNVSIVKARYGICISYKNGKLYVSIPKNKNYEDLTYNECAILINNKKKLSKSKTPKDNNNTNKWKTKIEDTDKPKAKPNAKGEVKPKAKPKAKGEIKPKDKTKQPKDKTKK